MAGKAPPLETTGATGRSMRWGGEESQETGHQHNLIQYDPAVKGDGHDNHGLGEAIFAVET